MKKDDSRLPEDFPRPPKGMSHRDQLIASLICQIVTALLAEREKGDTEK